MILQVENLSAGYQHVPIIHQLTFSINAGKIYGLIGLNGAGKTTTLKTILGQLSPLEGTVLLEGKTKGENPANFRRKIAHIPETPILYEELTLREHLTLTAKLYQQEDAVHMERALKLVDDFYLTKHLDLFPAYFSKGMKQKVLLACALMVDVPLYIVDEPFLGLDPLGIRTLLRCLNEKKAQGAAVLMSTHVLDTAERFCDEFIFLNQGKILDKGTLQQLRAGNDQQRLEDLYFYRIGIEGE